ncbi:olfactory receptor 6Y1-like [Gastrophryne carolinensis]
MCEVNQTQVTQISLFGFRGLYAFRILLFMVFLLAYLVILSGNCLIIILVSTVQQLKSQMFLFLKYLATSDAMVATTVVPMALDIITKEEGKAISLAACITQLYCFCIFSYFQSFLISAMSYDRYLAICNPLRYPVLMNSHVCHQLISGLWILAVTIESSEIIVVCQLNFCGLNSIDHFFCDFGPVVELSTSDTSSLMLLDFFFAIVIICLPFVVILATYLCILVTILKITSAHGRRKAFSTCGSHLTTVCSYYATLIIVYMVPSDGSSASMNKYRSLLYILVPSLINPIMYSLRTLELRSALQKIVAVGAYSWTYSWK